MKKNAAPSAPPAAAATPPANPSALRLVLLIAAVHAAFAMMVFWNHVSRPAIATEGTCAQFAWQVGIGHRPFGPTDVHFQEIWYNPLTFQVAGWFSRPFGFDIRAMRFSIGVFGLAAIALVGLLTHRLTGNRWLSFVAAGLFAGIDTQPWFVLIEPNALLVFFALLAVYFLLRDPDLSWRTLAIASVCLFLSYWSKQTGLAFIAAGVVYVLLKDFRKGLVMLAMSGGITAAAMLYYHLQPGSTYIEQTFSHGHDPMIWKWLLDPVLFPHLLGRFGILLALLLAALFVNTRSWKDLIRPDYAMLGAAAFVGLYTQCKYGSGPTQAILMYGLLIACGLAAAHALWKQGHLSSPVLMGLLILQGLALIKDPFKHWITNGDVERTRLITQIVATPGKEVYYVNQGIYNILAGKKPYANVGRSCWYKGQYDRSRYPVFWRKFVESDPWDIVIIDVPLEDNSWLLYERLNKNYQPVQEFPAPADSPGRSRLVVFQRKPGTGPSAPPN